MVPLCDKLQHLIVWVWVVSDATASCQEHLPHEACPHLSAPPYLGQGLHVPEAIPNLLLRLPPSPPCPEQVSDEHSAHI